MTEPQQSLRETIPLELSTAEEEIQENKAQSTGKKVAFIIGGLLILALVVVGLILLLQPGTDTARVRDIFIIFMALEFLLIGGVMVILIIQLARLTLLLQNEIKPILESTNETANTLRGTTAFLSEHLVEPVLKLNQYLAGLNKILSFFKSEKE
ncbi:MAG: phage holin family protein [Anaerolineales bacterium]|nr:phage holin family protein [Anaerolineales bacterium]